MEKRKGESTVPWGAPMLQVRRSDTQFCSLTNCDLPIRQSPIYVTRGASTCMFSSLAFNRLIWTWKTQRKSRLPWRHRKHRSHMHLLLCVYFSSLTTNNVQGAEGDVVEAVERTLPCLLLQLLHQDVGLLVHHFQEVSQDGEVEGGSQHLSPRTPLCAGADRKKSGTLVSCGTCTHLD